jgi:hypothetical protein
MATCSVVVGYQCFGGLLPFSGQNCAKMYWVIGQIGSRRRRVVIRAGNTALGELGL